MRTPLVVGNWKMHGTQAVARELAQNVRDGLKRPRGVEVVVCPPFTVLPAVAEVLKGAAVTLGAQNCHWEEQGAFTGEISPAMLAELGCRWVLIGHSERRHIFRETDEEINRKVGAVLRHGMRPVFCVGETEAERRQGLTFTVVEGQLRAGWAGLSPDDLARCVLAYEPVWAIGTGKNATPDDAAQIHELIRMELGRNSVSGRVPILYGGSVNAGNVASLLTRPQLDGVLVGGASLDAVGWADLVEKGSQAKVRPSGWHGTVDG